MTQFPWSESYAVGVESIDAQHQALMEAVGRIDRNIASGMPLDELCQCFDDLYAQTEQHFRFEEKLFNGTRFHRAREHKREHDGLLLILRRFRQSLDTNHLASASSDHARFLRDWLVNHIRSEDYVLGVHLNTLSKR